VSPIQLQASPIQHALTTISGSTAFRAAANVAIAQFASNNYGGLVAYDNPTLTSAGNILCTWKTNAGSASTNYITVHWSGSEAGIQSAAGPATGTNAKTVGFISTSATGLVSSNSATNYYVSSLCFSDTYQSTSIFHGKVQGVTYSTLLAPSNTQDGVIGVVAFNWVASAGFPSTNMTIQLANYILASGNIPVAMFTGLASDQTSGAWLIGRNIDSGTRLTALAESTYGTTTPVYHYAVGTNYSITNGLAVISGATNTNNIFPYPIETINGIVSTFVGNSGYSSGETLCELMTKRYASGASFKTDTNGTSPSWYTGSNYLLGYASTSDANAHTNATSNNLIKMNWNKVSNSTTAIAQGQYTFWSYEHLYIGASAGADDRTVANGISAIIQNTPTTGGAVSLTPNVNINDMVVGRSVDGGVIYPNY
jgi:hypothetical protein